MTILVLVGRREDYVLRQNDEEAIPRPNRQGGRQLRPPLLHVLGKLKKLFSHAAVDRAFHTHGTSRCRDLVADGDAGAE
jgi:hypothetical protein